MLTSLFDQRDVREPTSAESITEASHEFEPASAATDNDDAMKVAARSSCWHLMVRDGTRHCSSLSENRRRKFLRPPDKSEVVVLSQCLSGYLLMNALRFGI